MRYGEIFSRSLAECKGPVGRLIDGQFIHHQVPTNVVASSFILDRFPHGYRGYAIDVGASDGISINSTHYLEVAGKWSVLSVEANPYFKPILTRNRAWVAMCAVGAKPQAKVPFYLHVDNLECFSALRPQKTKDQTGNWEMVEVEVRTLDELLEQNEFPQLDALCLDIEGGEREALQGFDIERWKPKIIMVECWQAGDLDDVLLPHGYRRVWRSQDNDGYLKDKP